MQAEFGIKVVDQHFLIRNPLKSEEEGSKGEDYRKRSHSPYQNQHYRPKQRTYKPYYSDQQDYRPNYRQQPHKHRNYDD